MWPGGKEMILSQRVVRALSSDAKKVAPGRWESQPW